MRAYFAPVDRTTNIPTIFDPAIGGAFSLDSPPVPWMDLGWVENFERSYGTPADVVRSGVRALPALQFRGPLEARVEFVFRQWGKLQMALACGSEHMNVLATVGSATPAPSGGTPRPAVAVLPGSTASELVLGAGAANSFPAGTLVAVDVDYQQQTGFVGSGIAAAYVSSPMAVRQDVNYVRRVTFNVARVAEVTATSAVLTQPLLAGVPVGASAQAVVAFVDREGGTFFQEWSALFVAEEESGGRVCFYYPRLSPNPRIASTGTGGARGPFVREDFLPIAKPLMAVSLRASFVAMPNIDSNDGQAALCYRSYFPAAMAAVY
ncbi:MAG: hypothetical protein LAO24_00960 [Acidobacteriia bacterium]|nr:hypothetical protein [Terriglobia bacterium]